MSGPINYLDQRYKEWKKRMGTSLRSSGQLTDCIFQVGTEGNSATISAHKLVIAAASPVFEAMFYGKMAEDNEYIRIPDMPPDIFNALLEFIYTDAVTINTIDFAYGLYYGAEKYMLPGLVKKCSEYLISKLNSSNACRSYEFALIFEDKNLIDHSKKSFSDHTKEVLEDPTFEEIEANTLLTILALERMKTISSELTLFSAVERYANAQQKKLLLSGKIYQNIDGVPKECVNTSAIDVKITKPYKKQNIDGVPKECVNTSAIDVKEFNGVGDDGSMVNKNTITNLPCTAAEQEKVIPGPSSDKLQRNPDAKDNLDKTIRSALEKIRFLTMTAEEFVEGAAKSPLLTESEALAVLMNIVTTNAPAPMPKGWSESRQKRK